MSACTDKKNQAPAPSRTPDSPGESRIRAGISRGRVRDIKDVIGIFADEPLWDEVVAEVKALRERQAKMDAERNK